MNVTLKPQRETWVRKKVESGQYGDPDDVVDEALRLMEDQERFARLKAAIDKGVESYKREGGVPLTPELIENIKRRAREMELNGEEPDPDVWPG